MKILFNSQLKKIQERISYLEKKNSDLSFKLSQAELKKNSGTNQQYKKIKELETRLLLAEKGYTRMRTRVFRAKKLVSPRKTDIEKKIFSILGGGKNS